MIELDLIHLTAVERMRFPDGQPHLKVLDARLLVEAEIFVKCRITNPTELLELAMVRDMFRQADMSVFISYLMGARMDRRIDWRQPFTLQVMADIINSLKFRKISIFDPHSPVATTLLAADTIGVDKFVAKVVEWQESPVLVAPDAGAAHKVVGLAMGLDLPYVQCLKERDSETGQLSHFELFTGDVDLTGKTAVIIDDICDGGGTFRGIGKLLREQGAAKVVLYVSHGIFSKGFNIGMDGIYTTNSYQDFSPTFLQRIEEAYCPITAFDCVTGEQINLISQV